MNISDWILIDARLCHRPASCRRRSAVQRAKGQTAQILSFVGFHLSSLSFFPFPSNPIPSSSPCYLSILVPPYYPSSKVRLCCVPLPSPPPPHPLLVWPPHPPFIAPLPWTFHIPPTDLPRLRAVSPTPRATRSSIVIRVPSKSTANPRAFPLPPIVLGGPRDFPQSPPSIPRF